jgi:hypothetical protein
MSGSIKGSLENVVKGKLVLKGGKGVGGGAAASSSLSKAAGVSKEVSEAPKLQSSGPKVYDTRTPYEKVPAPSTAPNRFFCEHIYSCRRFRKSQKRATSASSSSFGRFLPRATSSGWRSAFVPRARISFLFNSQLVNQEFNAKLSSLPEINEIPNVAGGG